MPSIPLYLHIADKLAKDIARGYYAVGETLPTEPELAASLKVSRATVRAALTRLESQKQVSRKKNVGTRVESATPQIGYVAELASVTDLLQWARACQRVVQSSESVMLDQKLSQALGCAAGSHWLRVKSLRFDSAAQTEPVAHTEAYIELHYKKVLKAVLAQSSALIADLLEQQFSLKFAVIEQDAFGHVLSAQEARTLGAKPCAAALRIVRRYLLASGEPALVTVSVHPADRFAIRSRLRKE